MYGRHAYRRHRLAWNLAVHLLAGDWSRPAMIARTEAYLGGRAKMAQRYLIEEVLADWKLGYPPSPAQAERLIRHSRWFERAARAMLKLEAPLQPVLDARRFAPAERYLGRDLPQLETPGDVAAWLGIPVARLEWLADRRRLHSAERTSDLQHYTHVLLPKRSGGVRLVEAPKPQMKAIQRRILHDILNNVPAHDAAHGFVRGRSCLSGASRHAGERVVVTMDITDFFAATPAARVHTLFRRLGYPHEVAQVLTGLGTTITPASVLARAPLDWEARKRLGAPHLPQGGPTSPALANLVASRLDARLSGLAEKFGAVYTRYADDLSFSGDLDREATRLIKAVEVILRDEGWRANPAKTRVMRQSGPQVVTGIVVNQHLNVRRADYDELKAILFNCVKHGAPSQNREGLPDFRAHIDGRVGWVACLNPHRGEKLRTLFDQVEWA